MKDLWISIRENLAFLGVCLGISLLIFGIAFLCERLSPPNDRTKASPLRRITVTALSSALAAVLMLIDFPLFFVPFFYKLDFSELPILICGFALGPSAAVIAEFLKVLLKLLFKSTTTAFVGEFSNFVIGCSFVLPAAAIYRRHKTKHSARVSLLTGSLVMTVFGSAFNALYLIPQFARLYGINIDEIVAMGTNMNPAIVDLKTLVLLAVVPFNLLKALAVSFLTLILYKYIKKILLGS